MRMCLVKKPKFLHLAVYYSSAPQSDEVQNIFFFCSKIPAPLFVLNRLFAIHLFLEGERKFYCVFNFQLLAEKDSQIDFFFSEPVALALALSATLSASVSA